jgi:hypothetical protein
MPGNTQAQQWVRPCSGVQIWIRIGEEDLLDCLLCGSFFPCAEDVLRIITTASSTTATSCIQPWLLLRSPTPKVKHLHRPSSTPALVSTFRHDYFDDINIPDIVRRMDLLHLPITNLYCIDIYHLHQEGCSTTIPNAQRIKYLLTIALQGM